MARIESLEAFDGALDVSNRSSYKGLFLVCPWVADYGDLVVLLGSYDSYSNLYQKDHKTVDLYIYKKVRKGLDEKCDVPNANASLYSTKKMDQATHYHKSHH